MEIMLGEYYSGFENSLKLSGISRSTVSLAKMTNVLPPKVLSPSTSVNGFNL